MKPDRWRPGSPSGHSAGQTPCGTAPWSATPRVPEEEILRRRSSVQAGLQQRCMDGLLVTQPADVLYLTGEPPDGFLFLPSEGEPLLLAGRSSEPEAVAVEGLAGLVRERVRRPAGGPGARAGRPCRSDPNVTLRRAFPEKPDRGRLPGPSGRRMIKSAWELDRMDQLAERTREAFEGAREVMRPGMTEIAFAGVVMQARAGRTWNLRAGQGEGLPDRGLHLACPLSG